MSEWRDWHPDELDKYELEVKFAALEADNAVLKAKAALADELALAAKMATGRLHMLQHGNGEWKDCHLVPCEHTAAVLTRHDALTEQA